MDALVTDLLRSQPGRPAGTFDPAPPRRRLADRAADWATTLRRLAGLGSGGAPGAGSTMTPAAASRRSRLLAYTAAEIVLGAGLLAWSTVVWPIQPALDPGFGGDTVLAGSTGGLLLWLVYGLLGSLRALRAPGGAVMTFHMPFVGAAMVLGGPTAGAWVAVLSTIERRELESQPWYGILANHATLAIGAVAGGLVTQLLFAALGTEGTGALVAASAGAVVLAGVSTGLGIGTVLLREAIEARAFLELLVRQTGRITLIECALVVVLAAAYVALGWWAPLLIGGFVLLAWDNDPMPAPDPLTGLLTKRGFQRQLESGLGRMRRGLTPGATLLSIDLDQFKPVNDHFGHAVGDEVLREVGVRLRAVARRPQDLAGRLGGDELAMFLPGLTDPDSAVRRAQELATALTSPIATSAGIVTIGASIGVLVADAWGGVPSGDTLLRHADIAMYHAKRAGSQVHLFDPDEPNPWVGGAAPPGR
jgi:diguanylate cyclase (GGDEF)-like protein